ncbi:MAG: Flp pilus assembly protein CpaB [Firmicutes bacterium]|nr:Flp pilus assembly protein CpaB [Bacillota bacterium]
MKRRKLFLVAAILGLLAATLTYTYIRSIQRVETHEVKEAGVVVATGDIPSGTSVSSNMVRLVKVPETALHPEAASSPGEVIGRITKAPIVSGEQVLRNRLLPAGVRPSLSFAIPSGKRAVSVAVNEVVGVAGFVKPGDRVDILATVDGSNREDTITSTVLQDVEVLAIAQDMEEEVDKKPKVTTTVTLAVTLAEAQKVTLAEETGVLRLVLRPVTAANREWVNPTTSGELAKAAAPQTVAKPVVKAAAPPKKAPQPAKPPKDHQVEIIRGTERELISVKSN